MNIGQCPFCTHSPPVDNVMAKKPNPGDLVVCNGCGEVLEFKSDFTMQLASLSQLMQLSPQQHREVSERQAQVRSERSTT